MAIKTGLFLALGLACTGGWAQDARQPLERQPSYTGYPASSGPATPAPLSTVPEPSLNATGSSSGINSPGAHPVPSHSGGPDLNVQPREAQIMPGTPVKPLSPPAPMTRVEPVTDNGVTYLCGGIGLDESERLKREARNYDLMLTFVARDGSYLADVNIDISDARGQSLLKLRCDAPMMLIELPKSGTYHVRAETGGHMLTRTVQVGTSQQGKALTLTWPIQAKH